MCLCFSYYIDFICENNRVYSKIFIIGKRLFRTVRRFYRPSFISPPRSYMRLRRSYYLTSFLKTTNAKGPVDLQIWPNGTTQERRVSRVCFESITTVCDTVR